jgi:DNA invertase Pin-like site-specific DNA recombinase
MTVLLGENNGRAKLTRDQVLQIYEMAWSGNFTQREIAKVFWVSRDAVRAIKTHVRWAWLTQQTKQEN